jgi:hypothetical protein
LVLLGDVVFLKGTPVVWRIHETNSTFNRNLMQQIRELNFIDSVYEYSIPFIGKSVADKWKFDYVRGMFHVFNDIAYSSRNFLLVCFISYKAHRYWGRYSFRNVYIYILMKLKSIIHEVSIR